MELKERTSDYRITPIQGEKLTLEKLFDICRDLELRQAKLYASFALLLGDVDERIARFWEKMSTEEWQHYILVDFGRALCVEAFGIDTPISSTEDTEKSASPIAPLPDISIQEITDALDAHESKVESGRITLDEAFEIAIAIEGSEADTIYMYLLSIIRKAIRESNQPYLMNRIVQVERDMVSHVDGLVRATQRFSKDTSLIRKAHRLKEEHG
ncbi:hypothetical protein C6501_11490 [Candidatus Poribacteria bacterium]|nr:MAG: hypothetical protein C6501_11490 [Candidatus Poribacteria bacterium]